MEGSVKIENTLKFLNYGYCLPLQPTTSTKASLMSSPGIVFSLDSGKHSLFRCKSIFRDVSFFVVLLPSAAISGLISEELTTLVL